MIRMDWKPKLLITALAAWAVASVACVVTRRPVVLHLDRRETVALRVVVVVSALASWAWLLARRE